MYSAKTPFPVYCHQCWWSDKWDSKQCGRDYDFSKPFFEQFRGLMNTVPRPGIIKQGFSIDSEYTNRVTDQRGCYLVFGTTFAEFCRYGTWLNSSKECTDSYNVQKSERCYECIDCLQCYQLAFSQECNSCSDSWFLYDCVNCQDCFGCVNLRNKKYCIFNQQYTKEEYQKIISGYVFGSHQALEKWKTKFAEFKKKFIVPTLVGRQNNNVSGNWIDNSKNVQRSFMCTNVEEVRYCEMLFNTKDAMDFSSWGAGSERVYEAVNTGMQCGNLRFSNECWVQLLDGEYTMNCHNARNLFGCVGLRNAQFCILNKQYGQTEFEELTVKIRKQMDEKPYTDQRGRVYRYGEFFPIELSPHAYNETIAQEFFPLTKSEAAERGYRWQEQEEKKHTITIKPEQLPDDIKNVGGSLLKEVIGCAHVGQCKHLCTTAFRIIPDELKTYKLASLPLPRLCPNCRHYERLAKRPPLKLWNRQCQCKGNQSESGVYKNNTNHFHLQDHCPNEFETSYAPERPEIVYCEPCYQAEVI